MGAAIRSSVLIRSKEGAPDALFAVVFRSLDLAKFMDLKRAWFDDAHR